ncbi:MAG: hypothetical protein Q7J16_06880 [Candidatus Cloacimonadales bacterium]|nr:hypothetical protein [Candidatus Cloacimonadales bacterium]
MKKTKLLIILISIILLSSCAVQLVAEYDKDSAYQIIKISKKVDMFFITLREEEPDERQYEKSSSNYIEIEIELRTLIMLNKTRPKNEESTKIAEHILQNWLEFKAVHKQNNGYKDSLLDVDWNTIREQFYALAVAEAAKK